MDPINETDFMNELQHCIDRPDLVKGRAVLQFFGELAPDQQHRTLDRIQEAEVRIGLHFLVVLNETDATDASVSRRIFDLMLEKICFEPSLLTEYLNSRIVKRKTPFLRIAAELEDPDAIDALTALLTYGCEGCDQVEIVRALGAIGSQRCVSLLADYLYVADKVVMAAAIEALAQIQSPSAIQKLAEAVRGDGLSDRLIIEALAGIQNRLALDTLSRMLSSHFVEVRIQAMEHLTRIGVKAVPTLVENLKSDDSDFLIHTLTVLGHIGDETAVTPIRALLFRHHEDPNVRFTAYEALGNLPIHRSAMSLAAGLEDPVDQVRLAAARAIDANLNSVLTAGMKNMIAPADEGAWTVLAAVIDAEADRIFDALVSWKQFADMAVQYLAERTSPEFREHFLQRLEAAGKSEIADRIRKETKAETADLRLSIFAVDDSKMLCNLYVKMLHQLGHRPTAFTDPAEALAAAMAQKPDLVITDLNMPDINGLQLARELRSHYKAVDLPILMVTTQSDFVDGETAEKAGIDRVLHKPFSEKDLDAAINRLTGRRNGRNS